MPQVSSLIRSDTSHDTYEQDATRLAWLGYVVVSVVEEPAQALWQNASNGYLARRAGA